MYIELFHPLCIVASAAPVLDPASKDAAAIHHLFLLVFIICLAILVVIASLVLVSLKRFRANGDMLPQQNFGSHRSEMIWAALPVLIVIALSFISAKFIVSHDAGAGEADIVLVGHQWWWEVRYPTAGAVTANEIHIPVGRKLRVRVESADVIHSFWVPQLGPKMDMVRGHPNFVWLQADQPGTYEGACSEFCGDQHAWMRFIVIAESETEFKQWLPGRRGRRNLPPARPPKQAKTFSSPNPAPIVTRSAQAALQPPGRTSRTWPVVASLQPGCSTTRTRISPAG